MNVYVVMRGEYSCRDIDAIFSTREEAENYAIAQEDSGFGSCEVEEYPVDTFKVESNTKYDLYTIVVYVKGNKKFEYFKKDKPTFEEIPTIKMMSKERAYSQYDIDFYRGDNILFRLVRTFPLGTDDKLVNKVLSDEISKLRYEYVDYGNNILSKYALDEYNLEDLLKEFGDD